MNADKRFAKKLRTILEAATAFAEEQYPGDRRSQALSIWGAMQAHAGIYEITDTNNDASGAAL